MRTGLTKKEKTTAIYFDEYGSVIEVQTQHRSEKATDCICERTSAVLPTDRR